MHRRKRKLFLVIGIIVILAVLGAGGFYAYSLYNTTVTSLRGEIEDLKVELEEAQIDMDMVVCMGVDVKDGNPITEYTADGDPMLTYVEIPLEAATEDMFRDVDEVYGKLAKIDLPAGAIITTSMLLEDSLAQDERELDLVFDEIAIALEPGDYIDVRISFPLGQDYICMTKKRVVGIYDNVIKLVVNQDDIYSYESMKTDAAYYSATKIYCAKYVEAGIQSAAKTYYPVSSDILKVRIEDPNIDTTDWEMNLDSRLKLELALADDEENEDWPGNRVDKARTVTSNKASIMRAFDGAKSNYEKLQAQKAREAEKNQ